MREKETTSSVAEAVASFFIPGLGQFIQKRPYVGLMHLLLAAALWVTIMYLGWIVHLWSAIDAARFKFVKSESEKKRNV